MKTKDLIMVLLTLKPESEIVVQISHGEGAYSLHNLLMMPDGHIGYDGPIISAGEPIEELSAEGPRP